MHQHTASTTSSPNVIAWELTRHCALNCKHCRGAARNEEYSEELSTEECFKVIDNIATFATPTKHHCSPNTVLILTGGEPMSRPDIFTIARYASDKGLYVVMAPCGHMINAESALKIKESGIQAISISIDGSTSEQHDEFRGTSGAFEKTMTGLRHAISAGIPFQINTTVTKLSIADLPAIYKLACDLGAKTFDIFFLVPTGRGSQLKDLEISADEYERTLSWIHETSMISPIRIKTTCAPHYARILKQSGQSGRPSGGCMAGRGFVFISHRGVLQPCGFFDVPCGDLRTENYDFKRLYESSSVFNDLRQVDKYLGKCGKCEYTSICGGCRARALAHSSNYMSEEPSCSYVPQSKQ